MVFGPSLVRPPVLRPPKTLSKQTLHSQLSFFPRLARDLPAGAGARGAAAEFLHQESRIGGRFSAATELLAQQRSEVGPEGLHDGAADLRK